MRAFLAKYRLPDGTRGTLTVLARSSTEAIVATIDALGAAWCSARPAA